MPGLAKEQATRLVAPALARRYRAGRAQCAVADGSSRSAPRSGGPWPRHERHVVTERPQPLGDQAHQRGVVAAEIRPADRAGERHVADEGDVVGPVEEHHVAGRVPRQCRTSSVSRRAPRCRRCCSQRSGREGGRRRKPNILAWSGRRSVQNWSSRCGPRSARRAPRRASADAGMIDVGVRPAGSSSPARVPRRCRRGCAPVATRVDHRRLADRLTHQAGTVLLEGRDGDDADLHGGIVAPKPRSRSSTINSPGDSGV